MDREQIIFFIVAGVLSLINWVYQKGRVREKEGPPEKRVRPTARRSSSPPPPVMSPDEEARRRLMDALGIPYEEAASPTSPVAPPPMPSPKRKKRIKQEARQQQPLETVATAEVVKEAEVALEKVLAAKAEAERVEDSFKEYALPPEPTVGAKAYDQPGQASKARVPKLGGQDELRRAIILSEILGKPKALRM